MKTISYQTMVRQLLGEEEFLAFEQCYRQPVQKSIHLIKSRERHVSTQSLLENEGWKFSPPAFSFQGKIYDEVLFVHKPDKQSLGSHPFHTEGLFYVQEMAAGLAAQMLQVQPGERVLDLCAAPGGKTIQLADQMLLHSTHPGLLISNEVHPARRKALQANIERCGMWNVLITGYDGRTLGELLQGTCDKVLLDAPCSGEGMQYKSGVRCFQWNEKAVKKLAYLQKSLLIAGLRALKVGGELVYATCTTNTLENEGVIESVMKEVGVAAEVMDIEVTEKSKGYSEQYADKVARFRPHIHHTGGFFLAKLKKKGTLPAALQQPHETNVSLLKDWERSDALQQKVRAYGKAQGWKFPASSAMVFVQTKFTIWVVAKDALACLDELFVEQVGVPVLKILKDGTWKPLDGWKKLFLFFDKVF